MCWFQRTCDFYSFLFVFIQTFIFIWFQKLWENVCISFFFILLFGCLSGFIDCDKFIHTITNEVYKILLELSKGEFNVAVADRTRLQKSTIIKFWRSKGKFANEGDVLLFDGKKVWYCFFSNYYIEKQEVSCYKTCI